MFTLEDKEHIGRMRKKFFETGSAQGIRGVRPEVLEGWERSLQMGATIDSHFERVISPRQLETRIEQHREIYSIAVHYMKTLYDFLKEDECYIFFADADGYILKNFGSENLLRTTHAYNVREGAYRGLENPDYSLVQGCLMQNKPFCIFATEQSFQGNDDWSGVAAPVFSREDQALLGVIGISCYWDALNSHSEGLVRMIAEAISYQLELEAKNRQIERISESLNFGIATLNSMGGVTYINSVGRTLLGINKKEECYQSDFGRFLGEKFSFDEMKEGVRQKGGYKIEIPSQGLKEPVVCAFTGDLKGPESYMVDIRKTADLRKMASDMIGSDAPFLMKDIIGESPKMGEAKKIAAIAANHAPHTLLLGESGTGKELFAQAIHNEGIRAKGPFVAVNCGAIPMSLIESELFGYEGGAFTGAQKKGRPGKFELANGGTIFLDEIGDMPFETQIVLLRVLQSKEVTRIGGKNATKVDVAVIAATNQDLIKKIREGTFRADLYYRLNTFVIPIPPLRDRTGDIPLLTDYFISRYAAVHQKEVTGISQRAVEKLCRYSWPGNVRQLENVLSRAVLVCGGTQIEQEDLLIEQAAVWEQEMTNPAASAASARETPADPPAAEGEKEKIQRILSECEYNLTEAAKRLGISRPTIYKKIKKYQLDRYGENL